MQVLVNHPYAKERWEKTDRHCPACGVKAVWVEDSDGDYYVGPTYLCVGCGESFTMQGGGGLPESTQRTLQQLRDWLSNAKGVAG